MALPQGWATWKLVRAYPSEEMSDAGAAALSAGGKHRHHRGLGLGHDGDALRLGLEHRRGRLELGRLLGRVGHRSLGNGVAARAAAARPNHAAT